ncbi:MAG TPA: hypothetical protein VIU61_07250 [Kofleriaceae bacterium]
MRVVVLLALGACFSPSAPSGVPCAPEGSDPRCPTGQVCIDEVCRPPGFTPLDDAGDPAVDGRVDGPPGDVDADDVPDAVDDCPDIYDPQQYNEDGDKFGDLCDPCPGLADDTPTDGDGDGVQDECDPNPTAAGDTMLLFEGFHNGIPTGWLSGGPLTVVQGAIAATVGDNVDAFVGPPTLFDRRGTVSIGVTITAFETGANGVGAGHRTGNEASMCTLFIDGSIKGYGVIDLDTDTILNGDDLSWSTNSTYTLAHGRRDSNSTCTVTVPTGTRMSLGAQNDLGAEQVTIQAFTRGISVKFAWLMYVDSP